jgi:type IX secretion system PorP/SprF family membrane protein
MSLKIKFLRSILIALLTTMAVQSYSQTSSLFSHYYWNEQFYNPAYVGSKEVMHAQVIDRLQWVGMEGAPKTLNLSVHTPLKKENIAVGINYYNDRIGALMTNGITAQYAYRLKFKEKYTLSFGVNGGAEFRSVQSSKLTTDDGMPDIIQPGEFEKSWMPIFGAGVYFYGENFSIGLGAPQILPSSIFKDPKWGFKPTQQYFISGSYQWNINNDFRLLPTATIRIAQAEPTQAEFTVNGIFLDKFLGGLGVRTDKSVIFLAQYMHSFSKGNKKLNIGYSYDLSWKALRPSNSGSHEIVLSFDMPVFKTTSIIYKSPRYF